jgi:hypothetical protein
MVHLRHNKVVFQRWDIINFGGPAVVAVGHHNISHDNLKSAKLVYTQQQMLIVVLILLDIRTLSFIM